MTDLLMPVTVDERCATSDPAPLHPDRELEAVASMLRSRFPDCRPEDIGRLVRTVYTQLAEQARVRTHLIPLTLNRCRRTLMLLTSSIPVLDDDRSSAGRQR
ncbi:three-helix bundle dimerization domain-containing protein [Mycolicibacterium arenosum]|uniref:Uncharacterized protein n=1 Tax=Mycolicibacterium arenosum TaxID=2952157 RepID=A0ABT1LVR7_9MYCO|nr:hypothetical protein [Mycolicibacterium sp. CAU 1645]MCP9271001.1 hypothetical protein [Mycolicibacterium sp. CAU 1645]